MMIDTNQCIYHHFLIRRILKKNERRILNYDLTILYLIIIYYKNVKNNLSIQINMYR